MKMRRLTSAFSFRLCCLSKAIFFSHAWYEPASFTSCLSCQYSCCEYYAATIPCMHHNRNISLG